MVWHRSGKPSTRGRCARAAAEPSSPARVAILSTTRLRSSLICGVLTRAEHIATFKTSKRVSIDGSKADYSTFKLHAEHSGVVATIQNPTKMTPDSPFAVLVDSQEEREYFQMQTPPKRPFKQQTKW